MATVEETRILHIEIDQGAAEKQLEKVEGILLDNKKAVQDLAAAYKKGNVTQEEYVKENIRLQQNIKKEQDLKKTLIRTIQTESNSRDAQKLKVSQLTKEYDGLNLKTAQGVKRSQELEKELKKLTSQLTQGDNAAGLFKNQIGNYPKVLQDAASNIKIAGTSVGSLATGFTALLNPVTAGVAVIGALGAAYARSTIGAKDLNFAQNQIAETTTLITNRIAGLISSAEDGEGALTKLFNLALTGASSTLFGQTLKITGILDVEEIRKEAKELALVGEKLEDLNRLEQEIRTNASQRLEENQELLEVISDEQTTINEKIAAANTIEQNLVINKRNILDVLNSELKLLEDRANANVNDEVALDAAIAKRREISAESAALERSITRINKQQQDLNDKLTDEQKLRAEAARQAALLAGTPLGTTAAQLPVNAGNDLNKEILEESEFRNELFLNEVQVVKQSEEFKREAYRKTAELRQELDQAIVTSGQIVFNTLSKLAEDGSAEQKGLALVSIAFNTAEAIAGATAASQDIPYPGNLAAMATSIATVLANIAQAYDIIQGFEEGGYTGDGAKHDVAGIVHKGEYVVPQSVNYSPAAQPHIAALENMRVSGYADGGFVTHQSTAPVNQSLIMANALSRLPRPIVDVREVTRAQQRIEVRETSATLSV